MRRNWRRKTKAGSRRWGNRDSEDTAALRREADQLASMAASLPSSMDKVSRGVLDKDLIPKLKQIEKLSKHLRNELNH